jgi:hypothetical protein
MPKRKTEYVRKRATIRNLETGKVETFDSIAAAKRKSRELQGNDLGSGLVKKDSS